MALEPPWPPKPNSYPQLLSDGRLYNVNWTTVKRQHDLYKWAIKVSAPSGMEMARIRIKEWKNLAKLLTIPGGRKT